MAEDKKKHLICGFLIAFICGIKWGAPVGLVAGVLAGLGKEAYDFLDYGDFDEDDMMYTWVGALLGTALSVAV